jgi:hypothetical protein
MGHIESESPPSHRSVNMGPVVARDSPDGEPKRETCRLGTNVQMAVPWPCRVLPSHWQPLRNNGLKARLLSSTPPSPSPFLSVAVPPPSRLLLSSLRRVTLKPALARPDHHTYFPHPPSTEVLFASHPHPHWSIDPEQTKKQANPTITHPNASDSSSSFDPSNIYSLLMRTNTPYRNKNAGSWQTSPSILATPPRGSCRSTTRLGAYSSLQLHDSGSSSCPRPRSEPAPVASASSSVFTLAFRPVAQIDIPSSDFQAGT